MIWYTIKEASKRSGCTEGLLRFWNEKYGWPSCVRQANGYRLFSDVTVAEVREFIHAGRPFHQLDGGCWDRPCAAREPVRDPLFLDAFADIDGRLLQALKVGAEGTVAHYLAALGRMRPEVRERYVHCIRAANHETGGLYSALIARYRIAEPQREEAST